MRTDLDHLPPAKRRELERVVQILFEEFEAATEKANGFGKHARIFKIVLYGSYARGDWVDDPIGGYHSDYDILIVVSHDKLTDFVDYWSSAEDRLMRELTIARTIGAHAQGREPAARSWPPVLRRYHPPGDCTLRGRRVRLAPAARATARGGAGRGAEIF